MTVTLCITIFLTLYVGNMLLDIYLSHLNMRHVLGHSQEPPKPFIGFITPERYQQSIAYTVAYHKFSLVSTVVSTTLFIVVVYTGLLDWLDRTFHLFFPQEIHRGVVFFLVLLLARQILSIPFDLYATFVIEEKFGFNRQTWRLWLKDELKGLLLSLGIMIPLSYAILYFMKHAGGLWWLYVWAIVFVVGFTLSKLYPILIAPLFNKFTPLPEGPLRNLLQNMAQRAHFPLENICVMDASVRTSHPNAYFAGFGKTKRLVLFDSLMKDFTQEEIAAVVAHEIGHDKGKHLWKQLAVSEAVSLLFFYCLSLALTSPYLYQTFLISNYGNTYMGLILLSCVVSTVFAYLSPLFNLLSWRFESAADRYSYELVEVKDAVKTLLAKLAEKSLSNLTPHPLYARFYYSHPPVLQRLQSLGLDK